MQFNKQWKELLMEERYPDLLLEARVKDVKAKYPGLDKTGWINWGRRQLEDVFGPKGVSRYLMWYARELRSKFQQEEDLENQNNVLEYAEALMDVVQDFQQNAQRLDQKDIYKYDAGELQYKLDKLGISKSARLKALKDEEQAKKDSEVVYNDHAVMAIRPLTTQSSCYYGHNPRLTTWCISTKSARNYFNQYTSEGKAFVITRFFGIPEGSVDHIIALELNYRGKLVRYWNAPNKAQDPDDLYSIVQDHVNGLKEYKDLDEEEREELVDEIYSELTNSAAAYVMDNPPPDPFESAEKACDEIMESRDFEYVAPYYQLDDNPYYDDEDDAEVYVMYNAHMEIRIDTTGEEYENAPKNIENVDYASQTFRDIGSAVEERLRDAGIYGFDDVEIEHDGDDIIVLLELRNNDFAPNIEGFREFVNFECAAAENEAENIKDVVKSYLTEKGYRVLPEQQTQLPGIEEEVQKYFKHGHLTKQGFYDSIEKELLPEEKGRTRQRGIYRIYMMLGYTITTEADRARGLDDILADIRALPYVTIVTVAVKNQKVSEGSYIAGLSIKFIPSIPGKINSPEDVKARIISDIRDIKNVNRIFKVTPKVERLE